MPRKSNAQIIEKLIGNAREHPMTQDEDEDQEADYIAACLDDVFIHPPTSDQIRKDLNLPPHARSKNKE